MKDINIYTNDIENIIDTQDKIENNNSLPYTQAEAKYLMKLDREISVLENTYGIMKKIFKFEAIFATIVFIIGITFSSVMADKNPTINYEHEDVAAIEFTIKNY